MGRGLAGVHWPFHVSSRGPQRIFSKEKRSTPESQASLPPPPFVIVSWLGGGGTSPEVNVRPIPPRQHHAGFLRRMPRRRGPLSSSSPTPRRPAVLALLAGVGSARPDGAWGSSLRWAPRARGERCKHFSGMEDRGGPQGAEVVLPERRARLRRYQHHFPLVS